MSWYLDMQSCIQRSKNAVEAANTLAKQAGVDYGQRKIELPEAYWRTVISQVYAVARLSGLPWEKVVKRVSGEVDADESTLLPSLIVAHLYDRFSDLDPVDYAKNKLKINLEAVQASLLHAWGYGKAVVDIDPDVAAAAAQADIVKIPRAALNSTPYKSMYIPYKVHDFVGCFFHLFKLPATGQQGISFLMVKEGWPNRKAHEEDFCAGTIDMDLAEERTILDIIDTGTHRERDAASFRVFVALLLLTCARNVDIVGRTTSTFGPSRDKKTQAALLTPGPRHWDVGVRQGAALRASGVSAAVAEAGGGTELPGPRGVRAHLRRAHWHSYWFGSRGSDDRRLIVHWIQPVLVGAAEDVVETHHKLS